eukprot:9471119-Pyramimonas_sp.AAC.1
MEEGAGGQGPQRRPSNQLLTICGTRPRGSGPNGAPEDLTAVAPPTPRRCSCAILGRAMAPGAHGLGWACKRRATMVNAEQQ